MNRYIIFICGFLAFISFGFVTIGETQEIHLREGPKANAELKAQILTSDAALFDAVFTKCDIPAIGKLLTKDVKFIHDKWGVIANNRNELIKVFKSSCERQKAGTDFKARRELLVESTQIHALNQFGAIEIGKHRFFAIEPDGSQKPTESGDFIILWKKENGVWKMAETISYNHELAK